MAFTQTRSRRGQGSPNHGPFDISRRTFPANGLEFRQVAAVCYRVRKSSIEFLLVQTRGGRWTFPKGNVEPGMSCAQVAALEAFEEAGVHGSVELAPFARYQYRKRKRDDAYTIHAHLCHVHRLHSPQEENRNPQWFSSDKAKVRLHRERKFEDAAELARVVDRAVMRIERLRRVDGSATDPLRDVKFDAFAVAGIPRSSQHASIHRYLRREGSRSMLSASPIAGLLAGRIASPRKKPAQIVGIETSRAPRT
jgi:8-oxo-dGTP pyrophosphatase MutT (NUDIX family)